MESARGDGGPRSERLTFSEPSELISWALRRQRRYILAGAVAGTVWMAAIAVVPVVVGRAIDVAVSGGERIGEWSAVVAAVVVIGAIAGVVRHRIAVTLAVTTARSIEQLMTARLLDERGGAATDSGTLLATATNDAQRIGAIADLMCRGTGAAVTFLGVGAYLVSSQPVLGALVLIGLPITLGALSPLWSVAERRAATRRTDVAAATSTAADTILGLRTVLGFGAADTARRWFGDAVSRVERSGVELARVGGAWTALSTAVPALFLAVVLFVAGTSAIKGDLSAGDVVAITGLATFLRIPLRTIAEVGVVWSMGRASARQIASVLAAPPASGITIDADRHRSRSGDEVDRVEFRGVTFGPLVDLSIAIGLDELAGVACADGESAATIVDLVGRAVDLPVDPMAGSVRWRGSDVRHRSLRDHRREVLVERAADPWLGAGTVGDALDLGAPDTPGLVTGADATVDPTAMADAHLDALHVAALAEVLEREAPLEVPLGERGLRLSGGQRQRLALARAIRRDAPLLVVADPTSALDSVTESIVAARLAEKRRGRCTIVVSTSPTMLANCDRIVLVDAGRCVDTGSHHDLLQRSARYRQLVGVDS